MERPPIVIRVSKMYAGIFFALLLAFAFMGISSLIEKNDLTVIGQVSVIAVSLFALFIASFGLYSLTSTRFSYDPKAAVYSNAEPHVTITDMELICRYPSINKEEKIVWKKVNLVQILTTDEGPAVCDVFIVIRDSDGGAVVVPQDKQESKTVLDKVMKYPGFDAQTLIEAMGCAENKWFTVWKKD